MAGTFDDFLRERDDATRLDRSSLLRAAEVNPDEAGEAQRLAPAVGLPAPVVQRNLPEVRKQQSMASFEQFLLDTPELEQLSRDENFLAVAQDQTQEMGAFKQTLQNLAARAGTLAGGLTTTVGEALQREQGLVPAPFGFPAPASIPGVRRAGEFLSEQGQRTVGIMEGVRQPLLTTQDVVDAEGFLQTALTGLGWGIETTVLSVPDMLFAMGSLPLYATSRLGEFAAGRAADQGGEITDRDLAISAGGAVVSALLERFGAERVLGSIRALGATAWRRVATAATAEGTTEFLQEGIVEPLAENLGINPLDLGQMLERGLWGALGGAVGGGALRTGAEVVNAGLNVALNRAAQAEQAKQLVEQLEQLNQLTAATKLRERNPEQFEKLVEALDPATELYVAPTDLQDALEQSGITLPDALQQRVEEAAEAATPVRLSVAEYVTHLTQAAQQLNQKLRIGAADAMNAEEAANIKSEFSERAEQAIAAADDADALANEGEQIRQQVQAQIVGTGRFRSDVAEAYASLVRDFFVANAQTAGVTPAELFARYPLRVQAAPVEGEALEQAPAAPMATPAAAAGPTPAGFTRFRHFGNREVPLLDPRFMGTGLRGEERTRGGPQVISLYPDEGFTREPGTGNVEYAVDVPTDQLYDFDADPLNLKAQARPRIGMRQDEAGQLEPLYGEGFDATRYEQLIRDAGFLGYVRPNAAGNLRGQARLFTSVPVAQTLQQSAFHGTPHRFERFDLSKIGTGEGNQSFGWGIYFADERGVAEGYRQTLAYREQVRQFMSELPENASIDEALEAANSGTLPPQITRILQLLDAEGWLGFDSPARAVTAAFRDLESFDASPELQQAVQDFGGQLHAVDIPDAAISQMLDWDTPISEQPHVMAALDIQESALPNRLHPDMTGQQVYRALATGRTNLGVEPNAKAASEFLRSKGIPGLRYLDAGSRRAGEGTRNTVVWDQDLLDEISQRGERLPGLPASSPGPVPAIKEAAMQYIAALPVAPIAPPQTEYVKVDVSRAERIAAEYDAAVHDPANPEVAEAYDALIRETLAQYQLVKQLGLDIEFIQPGQPDPYTTGPREVHDDLRRGHLWVFPTDLGFGQEEAPNHPLLQPTNELIGDHQLLANDVFRIVHDVFGHGTEGVGFGPTGEENAFQAHVRMYTPAAARAMTTETRGQNSWVNYGPQGAANRANQKETVYAEQKAALLPLWVTTEGVAGAVQTNTAEFKAWFGDSKIVDGDGEPLVVYHGTREDFDVFDEARQGQSDFGASGRGFYFSEDPGTASAYAVLAPGDSAPSVLPVFLAVQKPYELGAMLPQDAAQSRELTDRVKAAGYDAITSRGEDGVLNEIVVFQPGQIKSAIGNRGTFDPTSPSILEQPARGTIQFGQDISATPSVITLLQNADLSTFLHESGHFFFEVLTDLAARPDSPAQFTQDAQTLLDWVGFTGTAAEWRAAPIAERRAAHEKFAEGFEAWLLEGKAPDPAQRRLFQRFRAWLLNVYASLSSLNVQLTDEVRSVMGRMIAARDQVAAAEQERDLTPLFGSREEANMTVEEWQAYQDNWRTATDNAQDQLQARSLRNVRWLDNARSRELKKLQKANAAIRDAIREEVEAEVAQQPERVAETLLRTGQASVIGPDGEQQPLTIEGPHRLSSTRLTENGTPWENLPRNLVAKDGLDPDGVAELVGVSSGSQLVQLLSNMQPREQLIEQLTDQRVLERHGDLTNEQELQRAVDIALHNQMRTRMVATELSALEASTRAGYRDALRRAAREFAERVVRRKRIRDVRPGQFAAAEGAAARESQKALKAGDSVLAAARKRDQLFNGYANRAAARAQETVEKHLRYLARFSNASTRKNLEPGYRDQIDKLLERFNLRPSSLAQIDKRTALANWIKEQQDIGNEPAISDELMDEAQRTHYRNLTVEQFDGLVDAVKNIEHLARLKNRLLVSKRQREFDKAKAELVASIEQHAPKARPEKLEREASLLGKAGELMTDWLTHLRKMSSVVRIMDAGKDGGLAWEYFVRPFNDAADTELAMRSEASQKLGELLNKVPGLNPNVFQRTGKKLTGNKLLYVPAIQKSLSLEARLSVALNAGNAGNRARLLEGNRWTPVQLQAVIDTLSKTEMDFVQGVLDYIGSFWPQIKAKEERISGVSPESVEPSAIQTRHGEYRGGYYPIVADPTRSDKAAQQNDAELIAQSLRGAVSRATTRRGHTKERVGGKDPVRLDLGVIAQHVSQVIHDLAWHETLIDYNKLLRDRDVSGLIRERYGHEITKMMRRVADDVARGEVGARTASERILSHMRIGSTVTGLGLSATTTLLQISGFSQSFVRVGYRAIAGGILQYAAHPVASTKAVYEKSPFMRDRSLSRNRELSEIFNKLDGQQRSLSTIYFLPIQAFQTAVDVPTWLGAYNKALQEGADDGRAVALADQAVRDAQSAGAIHDLAEVQRGGPLLKLFTNFYSYFSATYQLAAESAARVGRERTVASVLQMATDYLMLVSVPVAFSMLLKDGLRGDDDDDALPAKLVKEHVSYALGMFPLVREVGGALEGFDYRGPAGMSIFSDATGLIKQAQQGEVDEAFLRALNRTAGTVLHYPAGQVDRTVRGMIAIAEGDAGPQAVLVGPPVQR